MEQEVAARTEACFLEKDVKACQGLLRDMVHNTMLPTDFANEWKITFEAHLSALNELSDKIADILKGESDDLSFLAEGKSVYQAVQRCRHL